MKTHQWAYAIKFYHVVAYELAWRGGEAANCKVFYFKEEI